MTDAPVFAAGAHAWLERLGGLRDAVRQELVTRQLTAELAADGPLRVLDIGCGQGTQALRLAAAGHTVTGLESEPTMLEAARAALASAPPEAAARVTLVAGDGRDCGRLFAPASFDAVLLHGVLMYLDDPAPLLAAAVRVLAPGGRLSVLVRNADALAMRPGLSWDFDAALAAFDTDRYTNRLGMATRADRREDLTAALRGLGAPVRAWYGVRVFTDTAPDGTAPPADAAELERVITAEQRAGATDPYRAVAALLHLVGVRDSK